MLIPDNVHPENTIYYNGSLVLKELQEQPNQNLLDLYQNTKKWADMSFPVFVLCLDWLFLLNIAKLNDSGKVELCS